MRWTERIVGRRIFDTVSTRNRSPPHTRNTIFPSSFPPTKNNRRHLSLLVNTTMPSSSAAESSSLAPSTTTIHPIQEDNPCWGSPTQCDLKYLISKFPKEISIVYESIHYVVLNKPPDLRMDGPYPSTVHKLLTYWYPPPSLLEAVSKRQQQRSSDKDDDDDDDDDDSLLLEAISKLHQHNSIADNALRPCHQLDYATSGLLCVARTQAAAAHAIRQWEQRKVTKEYLALVEGSLPSPLLLDEQQSSTLPRFTPSQIRATLERLEHIYKQSRRPKAKRKDQTFQGFQPAHAIFQKFKATMLVPNSTTNSVKTKKKRGRPEVLTPEQWDIVWKPVWEMIHGRKAEGEEKESDNPDGIPTIAAIPTETLQLIQSLDWKQLCRTHVKWKSAFEEATELHNNLLRKALQKQEEADENGDDDSALTVFPTIFGESVEDDDAQTTADRLEIIYVCCPLGQGTDPNDFSMKVPPDPELLEKYPHMKKFAGPPNLDYKPSLTKCTILSRKESTDSSIEEKDAKHRAATTTKVQLLPMTGRRHQLRVHMAFLVGNGYGILGDATYNQHTVLMEERRGPVPPSHNSSDGASSAEASPAETTAAHQQRMCLHSHKLSLRLLVSDGPTSNESNPNDELVHLEAPDPF